MLRHGRALVIFDGLDELLDTNYRQEIRSDIETFYNLYPTVPILVTSRVIGYEQSPLDKDNFEIFHLAQFDKDQIKEYVDKWFATDYELSQEQKTQKVESFLKESDVVPDLRSNPLMLALICNIYKGEGYIPKNRAEVYQKCATMLYSRWDSNRGINSSSQFEEYLLSLIQHLAFWIYSNENLQSGVSEHELKNKSRDYLNEWFFDNQLISENASEKFIEFCKGRAWIFTAVGTTLDGVELFQFTHRTFLEYFTAANIVSFYTCPETLLEFFYPKIIKREWDVVAQLAFHIQSRQIRGANDELLLGLLTDYEELPDIERLNVFSFTMRCLAFMIPRPQTTYFITERCIEECIGLGLNPKKINYLEDKRENYFTRQNDAIFLILNPIFYAAELNQEKIFECLKKTLIRKISSKDDMESLVSIDLCNSLRYYSRDLSAPNLDTPNNIFIKLDELRNEILKDSNKRIIELSAKYWYIALSCVFEGIFSIEDFLILYGLDKLFTSQKMLIPVRGTRSSFFEMIFRLFTLPHDYNDKYINVWREILNNLSNFIIKIPPPWIFKQSEYVHSNFMLNHFNRRPPHYILNKNSELFCFFVLLSIAYEIVNKTEECKEFLQSISEMNVPIIKFFMKTLNNEPKNINSLINDLKEFNFTQQQLEIIERGLKGKPYILFSE